MSPSSLQYISNEGSWHMWRNAMRPSIYVVCRYIMSIPIIVQCLNVKLFPKASHDCDIVCYDNECVLTMMIRWLVVVERCAAWVVTINEQVYSSVQPSPTIWHHSLRHAPTATSPFPVSGPRGFRWVAALSGGRQVRQAATRPHLCSCYYQVICCCSSISAPHLWLTYNPPPAPTRIIFSLNAGQMHLHSAFNNINYLNVNSILNFILFTAA